MFPERLIEPCILAGSREGDTVLARSWEAGRRARLQNGLEWSISG